MEYVLTLSPEAEHFWEGAKYFIHAKGYATQRTSK